MSEAHALSEPAITHPLPIRIAGMLVEFDSPDGILQAAEKVRDAGFKQWDTHTPFPVHGLDKAMGVKPTILPWIVLCGGFTGAGSGLLMQYWMNAVDYQFLVAGKPYFSWPAQIPIIFELTILLSAFGAFVGMLVLNNLPMFYHATFNSDRFKRATSDRFFISIDSEDPRFSLKDTRAFLETLGGIHVETLEET